MFNDFTASVINAIQRTAKSYTDWKIIKRLFADDFVCYRRIQNSQDSTKLQENINHLANWANSWSMRFEPSKCRTMYITRKTTHKITHLTLWRVLVDMTCRANKLHSLLRRNPFSLRQESQRGGLCRPC